MSRRTERSMSWQRRSANGRTSPARAPSDVSAAAAATGPSSAQQRRRAAAGADGSPWRSRYGKTELRSAAGPTRGRSASNAWSRSDATLRLLRSAPSVSCCDAASASASRRAVLLSVAGTRARLATQRAAAMMPSSCWWVVASSVSSAMAASIFSHPSAAVAAGSCSIAYSL